jgi:Right handed beta helix region
MCWLKILVSGVCRRGILVAVVACLFFCTGRSNAQTGFQAAAGAQISPEFAQPGAKYTFYVAPNGNDSWSGRSPKLAAPNGPFATLNRARNAIRQLKASGRFDGPVLVLLRGGTYRLDKPFRLDPQDSGTPAAPITYAAYPGESPVISGGQRITGWSRFAGGDGGARGNLWVATVPAGWEFNELFFDGQWLQRSATRPGNRWEQWNRALGGRGGELRFPRGSVEPWPDLSSAEVNILYTPLTRWANMLVPVAGIDRSKGAVILSGIDQIAPLSAPPPWGIMPEDPFRIENLMEAISAPGQWSVDLKAGKVYLWPPAGANPNAADIEAPRIHTAIGIGGQGKPGVVRFVTLRGLTVTEIGRRRLDERPPPGGFDNFDTNDAALLLWGAEDCNIVQCRIFNVGGSAIRAIKHAMRLRIEENQIGYCGDDGVRFQGNGPGQPYANRDNLVDRNQIHNVALVFFHGSGVRLSMTGNTTISRNNIHDACGVGIGIFGVAARQFNASRRNAVAALRDPMKMSAWDLDIDWNALPREPLTVITVRKYLPGHVLITGNTIHDVVTAQDDSAGIYLWSGGPGDVISNNRIFRTHKPLSAGIYLDQEQSDTLVRGNIVYQCPLPPAWKEASLYVQMNWNNRIEDNVFALSNHLFQFNGSLGGHTVIHNIFLFTPVTSPSPEEPQKVRAGTPPGVPLFGYDLRNPSATGPGKFGPTQMDYNVYWTTTGGAPLQAFLNRWRQWGFDRHSVLQAPDFVNPQAGNFHVGINSPALKLGFHQVQ